MRYTGPMNLAQLLDHTLLAPDATPDRIEELCREALAYGFATVCVNGVHVRRCAELLAESPVKVCTVVGFPLGASLPEAKAFEAKRAIENGATEIDMVLDIGALKAGEDPLVQRGIAEVVEVAHERGATVKVIIEACLLDDEQKIRACTLAVAAGADYVKTSTGFAGGGATLEDVALMRATVGPEVGVKAAGGIHDAAEARAMVEAGATRIGASASVKIAGGA
jgi:deoxyribose-phosphate aldolase